MLKIAVVEDQTEVRESLCQFIRQYAGEQGLLAEVEKLKEMGCTRDMVSMQGLGYKEILDALDGTISLDEAVYIIKRDTRHFAKRQLTWFRRAPETVWVNKDEFGYHEDKMLEYMLSICREKGILG